MKPVIILVVALFAVIVVPMQISVGELMPAPTALMKERLAGFAEFLGVSCQWKTPTVWEYVRGGRPELIPNAVCQLRPTTDEGDPVQRALHTRSYVSEQAQRYFADQEVLIGFHTKLPGSLLLCYSPKKTIPWTRCSGHPDAGCLFAGCTMGLPPE